MARGHFIHEMVAEPMLDPVLILWTGVMLQALVDAEGAPSVERGRARLFLRGGTSFGLRNGRRIRSVDIILATLGIDLDAWYGRSLPRLERQWAAVEPHLAEIASITSAAYLDRRRLREARTRARAAARAA